MAVPAVREVPAPQPRSPGRASLLDLVPELADGLDGRTRAAAGRGAAVSTVTVAPGPWSPSALRTDGAAVGFLVAEGAIVREILLAGSVCCDLLGPGDVVGLGDDGAALVPADLRWTVSAATRVAVIDARLLAALEAWPAVTARLLARATRQTSRLAVQRAISQLPRVDQRLLALFWHLAERWGRVGRDGVVVRLALTHETLGRMVGARRPTVSLALKELATAGTIVRRLDGAWVLDHDGLAQLTPAGVQRNAQRPDAAVLPDHGTPERAPRVPDPDRHQELVARLRRLRAARVDAQRRTRETIEHCVQTRETVTQARRRRAAAVPPPSR